MAFGDRWTRTHLDTSIASFLEIVTLRGDIPVLHRHGLVSMYGPGLDFRIFSLIFSHIACYIFFLLFF